MAGDSPVVGETVLSARVSGDNAHLDASFRVSRLPKELHTERATDTPENPGKFLP